MESACANHSRCIYYHLLQTMLAMLNKQHNDYVELQHRLQQQEDRHRDELKQVMTLANIESCLMELSSSSKTTKCE